MKLVRLLIALQLLLVCTAAFSRDYYQIEPIQPGRTYYSWELPGAVQQPAWWRYQRPVYQSRWSYGWTPYGRGWSQTAVYDVPKTVWRCRCRQCRGW